MVGVIMIRLYDKEERVFDHLGIGSLSDVASAIVIEELNGSFEMEFEYPVIGKHLDDIKQRNIVVCKPNMHTDKQAFRIFEITKPFNGFITVRAEHVTYDASGIIVLPLWDRTDESETGARQIISFGNKIDRVDSETGVTKSGYLLSTIFNGGNVEGAPVASGINDAIILKNKDPLMQNPIRLVMGPQKIDEFKEDGFEIKTPSNLRSILGGSEDSLLEHFKGEYEFNNFEIIMHDRRGKDRDINIRYGKNMTDMEQETNSANLFTGLFPFYSKEYEESYVSEDEVFQKAYIRPGITALRTDWLSIEVSEQELKWGGIAMLPLVETMEMVFPKIVDGVETIVRKAYQRYAPVQVKTPGEFFDKIFVFNKAKAASGTSVDAYHTSVEKVDDVINVLALSLVKDGTTSIVPKYGVIYVIQNITAEFGKNSTLFGKKYIWDNGAYVLYDGNGFYKEALDATDATLINDDNPLPVPIPVEPIVYVNGEWVENEEDGSIYVEPKTIDRETHIIEKYKYVDLADYVIPEGESINTLLSEEGVIYVNEELKNLETQKILTLDLTQELDAIEDMEPEDMTPKMLFDKAEQYLKDHDLNRIKESVAVSFIKLSDDLEYEHLKQLEVVELGDDIHVIHEKLGISSKHRVISTEYNVITNAYNQIELGEKVATLTNNVVSIGDNVTSLKNDAEYTDKDYVVNFVAEQATIYNAIIKKAVINTLETTSVNISKSLSAAHGTIDELVANLLMAENATVRNILTAGAIRVRGHIEALSGEIGGCIIDEDGNLVVSKTISIANEKFKVDIDGNMTASSVKITGGTLDINNGVFQVDKYGSVIAKDIRLSVAASGANISIVDGKLYAQNAELTGHVLATSLNLAEGVTFNNLITIKETVVADQERRLINVYCSDIKIKPGYPKVVQITFDTTFALWNDKVIDFVMLKNVYVNGQPMSFKFTITTTLRQGYSKHIVEYTSDVALPPELLEPVVTISPSAFIDVIGISVSSLTVDGSFSPDADGNRNLGTPGTRWGDAYIKNAKLNTVMTPYIKNPTSYKYSNIELLDTGLRLRSKNTIIEPGTLDKLNYLGQNSIAIPFAPNFVEWHRGSLRGVYSHYSICWDPDYGLKTLVGVNAAIGGQLVTIHGRVKIEHDVEYIRIVLGAFEYITRPNIQITNVTTEVVMMDAREVWGVAEVTSQTGSPYKATNTILIGCDTYGIERFFDVCITGVAYLQNGRPPIPDPEGSGQV